MLAKLGQFLLTRFPEKVQVTSADYAELKADILRCKEQALQIDVLIQRLSVVESNAVHKQAVQDLIVVVKSLKDEYISLKASLGMARITDTDIQALLNGNPIQGDNQ
jgi:hypothetical protein